jgi:hypothetical protein
LDVLALGLRVCDLSLSFKLLWPPISHACVGDDGEREEKKEKGGRRKGDKGTNGIAILGVLSDDI